MMARKQVVRHLAKNADFDIYQAANGQEAINILAQQEIGLLCLDLTMPVIDGVGVLEYIKEKKIECFVVVISADIQPEMKEKVMNLGALTFLEKPVATDALNDVMHKFGIR
ncbi:hypothetical protein PTUN_a3269 [Pseudoalteromonas tunicata]|uniref:Putative response regulator with Chemotaxis-specific methylesterase domain n=2 Tax=Pseudoalteromonas tunicata TaxID=314281 RepID=A4C6Q2_9GAMM|nr:hypothetical protein PTUN_a3269 [Pseudoalteromonas tunicata]EAR29656.1 putative response regulator with Chemotaxis-specific methylesterase domain [Pseudoalteromonas tunicata D2]